MPFKDTWLRSQWSPDRDRFTVETPPDPDHGSREELPNAVVMQDAPILQGGGEIVTDAQMEHDFPRAKTIVIDETPVGVSNGVAERAGHGYGGWFGFFDSTEGYGRGILGALRGRDLGADRRATVQVGRPWRFYDDAYFGTETAGLTDTPLSNETGAPVLVRGLNAYDANDGPGGRTRPVPEGNFTSRSSWRVNSPSWKVGTYQGSNVQRGAFHPPIRTHHEVRYNQPNVVTLVGDAPPPTKPTKYDSPYSSLQRFGLNVPGRRRPQMRRQPGAWDEPTVAENTDRPHVENQVADSMVVP